MQINQNGANILNTKRQTYRLEIRKNQINQLINEKRRKIKQVNSFQDFDILKLDQFNFGEKEQIIETIAIKLRDQPNQQWITLIDVLLKLLKDFSDSYELWFKLGIIQKMISVLNKDYLNTELSKKSAHLLANLVGMNRTMQITKLILGYDFIKDLVQIFNYEIQSQSMINYLYLVGNLSGQNGIIRNQFINKGMVPILVKLSKQLRTLEQQRLFIWIISNIIKSYQNTQQNLKFSIDSVLVPIMDEYILFQDHEILEYVLYSLQFFFDGPQFKKMNIFHCKNIKGRLYQLILNPESKIRTISIRICAMLIETNNRTILDYFLCRDLYNQLFLCWTKYPDNYQIKKQIILLLKIIISNRKIEIDPIIRHELCLVVFEEAYFKQESKIKHWTLSLILQIINYATYGQIQYLLRHVELLKLLVDNVKSSNEFQSEIILISLKCIQKLIRIYDQIYTPNQQNTIVQKLEVHYQFSKELQGMLFNCKNNKIQNQVNKLIEYISHLL